MAYIFLPDTPDKARFLTEEEKVGEEFLHWFIWRLTPRSSLQKLEAFGRSVVWRKEWAV